MSQIFIEQAIQVNAEIDVDLIVARMHSGG